LLEGAAALGCGGLATGIAPDASVDGARNLDAAQPDVFDASGDDDSVVTVDAGPVRGWLSFEVDVAADASGFFGAEFSITRWTNGSTCTTVGGCVAQCLWSDAGASPGVSAGTMTISVGPQTFVVQEYDNAYSAPITAPPGNVVGAAASGGVVPAFAPQTIAMPATVSLIAPVEDDAGVLTIDTSRDLEVSWSGGQPGMQVVFWLDLVTPWLCTWDAAAGHATVASSVLQSLRGQSGIFRFGQDDQRTFAAGSFVIGEDAWSYAEGRATYQ